jgi:hypothetical protein
MSRMKPMSSMRSASSSTRISTPDRSMVFWLHVVEQAARGGHEDVHLAAQGSVLRIDVDATKHDHRLDRDVLAIGANRLFDLRREFARRYQNQTTRPAGFGNGGLGCRQPMQDRQRETSGLAGAGLRGGKQVAAFQNLRDGLCLNWCRCCVAGFGDGAQQGLGQTEIGEFDADRKRDGGIGRHSCARAVNGGWHMGYSSCDGLSRRWRHQSRQTYK